MAAPQRQFPQWLVWTGLILVLPLLFGAVWIAKEGLLDRVWPSDLLVVFGSRIDPDGQPSLGLRARLDRAVELYQEGISRQILVSGGLGRDGFDEAAIMHAYLVEKGVPDTIIWLDNRGDTTQLSAEHTAELMRQQGWTSAVLISQFYHLPRARLIFERAGVEQVGSAHAEEFFIGDGPGLLAEVAEYALTLLPGLQ
jgi:uncharacterized SAM-binding protein YcdF (DUF218 family)